METLCRFFSEAGTKVTKHEEVIPVDELMTKS